MERAELNSFVRRFACAEERGGFTLLRDPHWSGADQCAADALMAQAAVSPAPANGWLCLRTGGSSGGFKLARHDEHTLGAAVRGFTRHFGLARVNALGVLPPWHISGFMARLRCVATGGDYLDASWKALEAGELPRLASPGDWVLSLVPTQLQRLLAFDPAVEWLRGFRIIFLGGGPVWPALAQAAAAANLRVSLSYGMTETAAMVTAQQPAEFLAGDRSAGSPLPHVQLRIDAEGRVVLAAESLFRGYFPETRVETEFVTQDLGVIDHGRLQLLGRSDAIIITGGKKVQPLDVEAALRASGEFEDVAVIGVPDAEWGEIVVACYPSTARRPDLLKATAALAGYQRPKRFIALAEWPRNGQGKIDRTALVERVRRA